MSVQKKSFIKLGLAKCLLAAVGVGSLGWTNPLWAQATSAALTASAAAPKFAEVLATPAMLKALQGGGFALYLRHGPTDNSRPDRYPEVDLADCSTQRPLTPQGRAVAAEVGQAMRQANIPVAEIRISPMCRVKDTIAAVLPGREVVLDPNLMYTANLTSQQKKPILDNTRRWLAAPVAPGSNRLLVAHGPNLMDLMGYFPKEATLVIFSPKSNNSFDYVGSIPPAHWDALLR